MSILFTGHASTEGPASQEMFVPECMLRTPYRAVNQYDGQFAVEAPVAMLRRGTARDLAFGNDKLSPALEKYGKHCRW